MGREFFWHALRLALQSHLREHLSRYKELLGAFIVEEEWETIVAEAAPDYVHPFGEIRGLREVSLFY